MECCWIDERMAVVRWWWTDRRPSQRQKRIAHLDRCATADHSRGTYLFYDRRPRTASTNILRCRCRNGNLRRHGRHEVVAGKKAVNPIDPAIVRPPGAACDAEATLTRHGDSKKRAHLNT